MLCGGFWLLPKTAAKHKRSTPPRKKIVAKYTNFIYLCLKFSLKNFETVFLEAANEFIASLDKKSASNVFYNIDLAEQTNDTKIFIKVQGAISET